MRATASWCGTFRSLSGTKVSPTQRTDRHPRQGDSGPDGLRSVPSQERCFISAYDAEPASSCGSSTRWRNAGEPGGDTWGTSPTCSRAGGDTWIAGSYDPDLDLTYWGIAQAKPWMPVSRNMKTSDRALYTSSTVALPAIGELAWYFQHTPGESLDLDEVFERVLVDVGSQKSLFTIGKPASVEARSQDRRSSSATRRRSSRTSSIASISNPGVPTISAGHRRPEDRRLGAGLPEHRRRAQLAGDELSPAEQGS